MIFNEGSKSYSQYLEGGGEMGMLIRSFDWSNTIIGTPDTWSQSLLTTLSIILNSKFPMFLWWGPKLIQFYNDAYRPSLGEFGKHPQALGQQGEECWPEIWPVIKPLIDQVMAGGESTWSEDQLIPIYRNNRLEDVYWTFGYSKVIDESGKPAGILVICNETTEKVKSYSEVESAKNELAFIIESAELGTWDLDPVTNKFVGNDRMKSFIGLRAEEEMDLEKVLGAVRKEDLQKVKGAIQKALSHGSDGNFDVVYGIINPVNKVERIVKAKGKAIFDAEGNPERFSGILQDVTEESQVQQRKDEFISIASHELKTPLTSLNASLQLLERFIKAGTNTNLLLTLANKATKSLNKLLHLMEDLMNVAKIQQGQLALNKSWFNPADLINNCCEYIRLEGSYELVLKGDENLMVFADSRQIEQVIANLVNNAVKYAPQSKRIELNIEKLQNEIKISVRDFGIGIDPEKIPHLFDRYYRVESSGLQSSGLGLGLYICSEIISRHGGKIGVESELTKGSKFWFIIPIE